MSVFGQGSPTVFYKDILEKVSEEGILEYFAQVPSVPCLLNNPFRKDSNPSLSVYYSRSGRIRFKDHANGNVYTVVSFLQSLLELPSPKDVITHIEDSIEEIEKLDVYYVGDIQKTRSTKGRRKTHRKLEVKVRKWKKHDLEYWGQYGITEEWLQLGSVYPISHIFLDNKRIAAHKHAYAYIEFKDNKPSFKIYQPFSERLKWLSNHGASVWDLWEQAFASKEDSLIITSSRKDALTLWANLGIPSTALQSENTLPKPHIVEQLQNRFNQIWILYDNDYDKDKNPGQLMAERLVDMYNFTNVVIPARFKAKDPSDLIVKLGQNEFIKLLKQLL